MTRISQQSDPGVWLPSLDNRRRRQRFENAGLTRILVLNQRPHRGMLVISESICDVCCWRLNRIQVIYI